VNRQMPLLVGLLLSLVILPAYAGWFDQLKEEVLGGSTKEPISSLLNSNEMAEGLREALSKGVNIAIDYLGKEDGFLADSKVRIPMPDHLKKVSSSLRTLGQGKYADEFELTMNRAAEAAVPEARDIFLDAINSMTIEDARGILDGPDDAATNYFRKIGEQRLRNSMLPIVKKATNQAGMTNAYNNLIGNMSFLSDWMDTQSLDLNEYVTSEALNGLFLMIAQEEKKIRDQEEKKIRENPVARTTDLLKKVFSQ